MLGKFDLYGINVRPIAPVGSASRKPYVDSALIHRILLDELLFEVFARMMPYNLGRACVCRKWRYTICNPLTGLVENYKLLQLKYEGSWRKMWVLRPRVRTDGLYVSKNTYIRVGVVKWKVTNPLHTLRSVPRMQLYEYVSYFLHVDEEYSFYLNEEPIWKGNFVISFIRQECCNLMNLRNIGCFPMKIPSYIKIKPRHGMTKRFKRKSLFQGRNLLFTFPISKPYKSLIYILSPFLPSSTHFLLQPIVEGWLLPPSIKMKYWQ
ncbi:hypothetical protein UlMin_026635 [Ulmus minor]